MTDPKPWKMPEALDRCPGCGEFVSTDDGFCDVLPGGCRGIDWNGAYCGEVCADQTYRKHHHPETCACED